MRYASIPVPLIALLLTVGSVWAQSPKRSFDLGGQRLPTAEDLIEQIGSEADTRAIVSLLLREELSRGHVYPIDRVRLFGAQVRPTWLPSLGLQIELLDDPHARAAYAECAVFFALQPATVKDGVVAMSVTVGKRCNNSSSFYEFRHTAQGWQDELLPGGAASGMSDCACPAP